MQGKAVQSKKDEVVDGERYKSSRCLLQSAISEWTVILCQVTDSFFTWHLLYEGGREGGMDSHIPSLSNPASHALSSHYYAEDDTLFSYSSIYLSIYLSTYHDT